ncbi:MAG TPA: hypothetical protein VKH40_15770 [Alloacidobacterium sp.]|nr:hypothetical protein [Alloacidobacterium sp.]
MMFTFSFRSSESLWAWGFDIAAFWVQIPAVLLSFFKPRLAALAMLTGVGTSMLMGLGFEIKNSYAPDAHHLTGTEWAKVFPIVVKECALFWSLPILFAILLLRTTTSRRLP